MSKMIRTRSVYVLVEAHVVMSTETDAEADSMAPAAARSRVKEALQAYSVRGVLGNAIAGVINDTIGNESWYFEPVVIEKPAGYVSQGESS